MSSSRGISRCSSYNSNQGHHGDTRSYQSYQSQSMRCSKTNLSSSNVSNQDCETRLYILFLSPCSERSKKENLIDVVATQQKRAHMAILKEQWALVIQVLILIVGNVPNWTQICNLS